MSVFCRTLVFFLFAACGFAQQQFSASEFIAPYIPSPQALVDRMLEVSRVKPGETVYDLGCGDGRILITAAQKFKAKAVGVEISRDLFRQTSERVRQLGLDDQIKIIHNSMFRVDLSPADVVTLFLLTSANDRLRPNLEQYLKPGARVVSLDFRIRGWKPVETTETTADGMKHTIYLYQIAAKK